MVRFGRETKWIIWLLVALVASGLAGPVRLASAGRDAQADQELPLLGTIDAVLDAATPSVSATFEVQEAFPFSVVALVNSGDLTTTLNITGPDGAEIAFASPSASDAAITFVEAIIAPQAGIYTATVTRVGEGAGQITLGLLTGYAGLDVWDDFESANDLALTWSPFTANASSGQVVDGALQLNVHEPDTISYHVPDEDVVWSDLYIKADISIAGRPSYYEYGFVLRVDWEDESFYTLTVSSDSDWNLYYYDQNGEWNEIQPWTVSPRIDGSDLTPRLSVLVEGNTFRLYFNDVFVGEVTDTANFASEGTAGLTAATIRDQPDDVTVSFDDLVITSPFDAASGEEPGSGLEGLDPSTLFGDATAIPEDGPAPTPTTGLPFGLGRPTATPSGGLFIPTATPGGGLSEGLAAPTATPPLAPTQGGLGGGLFIPTATPAASSGLSGGLNTAAWSDTDPASIASVPQRREIGPASGSLGLMMPGSFGGTSANGYYPLGQG